MIGVTLFRRVSPKTGNPLPGYYCSFRIPAPEGGTKQVQRQTGQTNKREAEEYAAMLRDSFLREAGATDEKSQQIYRLLKDAAALATRNELTADRGRQFLEKMTEFATGTALRSYTITDWMEFWLANKKASAKPATFARYKNAVARFKAHLGSRATQRLETITSGDIQKFRDKLHSEGRSAKTSNGYLKDIRSCITSAVKEGLLPRNPASTVSVLSEEDSVSREPFTIEEVQKLIHAAPSKEWKGLILLGAFGGLRLGDAATLKAGTIDFSKKCITYLPQKTSRKKKVVTVPLSIALEQYFLDYPVPDDPAAPLFPQLAKVSPAGRNGLSLRFGALMTHAGISRAEIKKVKHGAGRTQYARSFHSLRHTFNSWLANADVSQEIRMRLTGHSTREINDIYTHTELSALKAAVQNLPAVSL
ncbi:MAG: tyrosine-type recombinase/integrase [Akkermansiaceae bacterium]|nr:tyrosine-type recombinase/integrase [Akkermansiaceae bacterium]